MYLGPFVTRCGGDFVPEFCLSSLAPNQKADGNYLNDTYCGDFETLMATASLPEVTDVMIYPNPDTDYIFLKADLFTFSGMDGFIYDATGKKLQGFSIEEETTEILLDDLSSGLYFLSIGSQQGNPVVRKFAVVR